MDFILSFEWCCLFAPQRLGKGPLPVSPYLCSVWRGLLWQPCFVCWRLVVYVGQRLCLHLFVPCAVDSACEETVEFSSEVAAVVGAAARLVSHFQHLDFEP